LVKDIRPRVKKHSIQDHIASEWPDKITI
jgi:hypothetical protein